ncbi:MAG: PEGA domain-containing protein [bacterium]
MKHRKTFFGTLCLVVSLCILLSGCAAILKGPNDKVEFNSDPLGAQVFVNGVSMGVTPIKLELASKQTYTIEFKKDGYESKTYHITNDVGAGWIVLDVLCGLVPVVIDAATGSWYGLDQDNVNAVLRAQQ